MNPRSRSRRTLQRTTVALVATLLLGGTAHRAFAADDAAMSLAHEWSQATFELPKEQRVDALDALGTRAEAAIATDPSNPDLLTWAGIIEASYAGEKGGLGALSAAKRARSHLEAALEIDPDALEGGARSTLGTLYAKVPGWPVGFGNDGKAEELLSTAAEQHPDAMNPLYFYGDYLAEEGRTQEAREWLEKAAAVPVRPEYRVADEGRLDEIRARLARLDGVQG